MQNINSGFIQKLKETFTILKMYVRPIQVRFHDSEMYTPSFKC